MADVIIKRHATEEELKALKHAGIKGMKWGRRRFQNEDGSLTEAGRKRYGVGGGDAKSKNDKSSKISDDVLNEVATKKARLEREKEELGAARDNSREVGNIAKETSNIVGRRKVNVPRMNLSNMTTKELKDAVDRDIAEANYDARFNQTRLRAEARKERTQTFLANVGSVAAVATSALGIAIMVKQLKG